MRRWLLLAIPWLLLAFVLIYKAPQWSDLVIGDFKVYYVAGQSVLGGTDIYGLDSTTSLSTTLRFTYPPFYALIMVLFALLAPGVAACIFLTLNVIALAATAYLVARELPALAQRTLWWSSRELTALILAMSVMTAPVLTGFDDGQIGLILLLLIVADFLWLRKRRGVLVGLATGIKVTPALFIVMFAAARKWGEFLCATAIFAATVVIGWLLLPTASREYWTSLLFDSNRVGDVSQPENTSLLGVLLRLAPEHARVVWVIAAICIVIFSLYHAARWYPLYPPMSMLLAAFAGLLISPISWGHHWVWLVVAIPMLIAVSIRIARWPAIFTALAAVFLFVVTLFIAGGNDLRAASYSIAGIAVLLVIAAARRFYPVTSSSIAPSGATSTEEPAGSSV